MGLSRAKALVFFLRNDFTQAISHFDELCSSDHVRGDARAYVETYLWNVRFSILIGQYHTCKSRLGSLYSSYSSVIDKDDYLSGMNAYLEASIYYYLGLSNECLSAAQKAEKHFRRDKRTHNHSIEYLLTMHMLGKAYWLKRDISNALLTLLKGASYNAEQLNLQNGFALAKSYSLIGSILMDVRRVEAALPFLQLSEVIYKNYAQSLFGDSNGKSPHLYLGILYSDMAECRLRMGIDKPEDLRYFKAYFQKSDDIFESLYQNKPHRYSANLLNIKSRYLRISGIEENREKLLSDLDREIAMRKGAFNGEKHSSIAHAHNIRSRIYFHSADYHQAMKEAQLALIQSVSNFNDTGVEKNPGLSSTTTYFSGTEMLKALWNKAEASLLLYQSGKQTKDINRAARTIRSALDGIYYILSEDLGHTESQFLFLEDTRSLHELAIRILHELTLLPANKNLNTSPYTLYELIQYNKSLLLLNDLSNGYSTGQSYFYSKGGYVESTRMSQRLKAFAERIDPLSKRAFIKESKNQLDQLVSSLRERKTPARNIDLSSFMENNSIRVQQREMHQKGIATLEFFVGKKDVYGIILNGKQIKVQCLTEKEGDYDIQYLKNKVNRYSALLSKEIPNYRNAPQMEFYSPQHPLSEFVDLSHHLYELLLSPFQEALAFVGHVYIIPDDFFWHLPFETLIESKAEDCNYFELDYSLKKWLISYHFSLPLIHYQYVNNGKSKDETLRSIAFAHGQTFEPEDESLLETLLNWKSQTNAILHAYVQDLSNSNDTSDAIIQNIIADIVLIWSHGGLFDGIRIDNERRIRMKDIQATKELRWKLLIVPNCYLGNGIIRDGEGMIALHRSFFRKGVENMIYTVNNLPADGTINILNEFFSILLEDEGISFSRALQQAKIRMSQKEDIIPSDWAGLLFLGHQGSSV